MQGLLSAETALPGNKGTRAFLDNAGGSYWQDCSGGWGSLQ